MEKKQWMLIEVVGRDIKEPEFFDTYLESHHAMKKYYEATSEGGIGELNDYDAWCNVGHCEFDWKIFHIGE